MKKSRHSELDIVKASNKLNRCISADVICLDLRIFQTTLYNWGSKYIVMELRHIKRLKDLEDENKHLKHIYADLALDNKILKDVIEKSYRA